MSENMVANANAVDTAYVIDIGSPNDMDTSDEKKEEFMPLLTVNALRSSNPNVVQAMNVLDKYSYNFGKYLGQKPYMRLGMMGYVILIHVVLIVLIL